MTGGNRWIGKTEHGQALFPQCVCVYVYECDCLTVPSTILHSLNIKYLWKGHTLNKYVIYT